MSLQRELESAHARQQEHLKPSTYIFQLPWERLTVVKPVPEAVEAMLDEVFCSSKIEPRIDCHLFQYRSPLANDLFTITLIRASKRY